MGELTHYYSETTICSIKISSKLSDDEIESLETSLAMSSIKLQKSPSRVIGADDVVWLDGNPNLENLLSHISRFFRRKSVDRKIIFN